MTTSLWICVMTTDEDFMLASLLCKQKNRLSIERATITNPHKKFVVKEM